MADNRREVSGGEERCSGPGSDAAYEKGTEMGARSAEELERKARHQEGEERATSPMRRWARSASSRKASVAMGRMRRACPSGVARR
jgi:hypothetical protein